MSSPESIKTYHRQVWLDDEVRLYYMECTPSSPKKGTILLIHGFPESSYQFRHVMTPLALAGYHTIAPDYKGHGYSSHQHNNPSVSFFSKKTLASELHELVTKHIGIKAPIHLVGHDIGAMIAHAYVSQFPADVASIIWGECPLPGSNMYETGKHTAPLWHFDFQSHQPDLAVALVTGKERIYLKHFFDRLTQNSACFTPEVVDFYVRQYEAPGAMRDAFATYRAFEGDAEDNREWKKKGGKVGIRALVLSGGGSLIAQGAGEMASEYYNDVKSGLVPDAGHYIAEENPEGFVEEVLKFIEA